MGKSSPSPPSPPDPAQTAAAQGQANKEAVRESAKVNQYNQTTPYGSVTWSGAIGGPDRTQAVTLNPSMQAALENQQRVTQGLSGFAADYVPRVANSLSTPFNTADLGAVPQANQQAWDNAYNAIIQRNQPQADRQLSQLQTQLANQGIGLGAEAYSNAMQDYQRGQNDFNLAAQQAATGQEAQQYGLEQSAYQQALSNALLNRTQGLNEVSALIQGSPAIQTPQVQQTAQYQIAPPDIMGANALDYQGRMNAYNQQVGNNNSMMGGLFGLGGALGSAGIMKWSDIRLKRDVERIGTYKGVGVYRYRYVWSDEPQIGVMAQEIMETKPEAVRDVHGYLAVDYGSL